MNVIVEKENLLRTQEPYDYRKSTFLKNLKKKNKEIKDGRIILFMKHQYLKRIVNLFQISIIFCSTIITFFESLKTQILLSEDLTQIISICLSTYIAISTAVFKFIKIDDKKEEIYKLMQNFNDLENNIMNKIQKVKLLQDKFEDETKFNTKTPYILNALYNSIIQSDPHGSYILRNIDNSDNNGENNDNDKPDDSSKKSRTKSNTSTQEKTQRQRKQSTFNFDSPSPRELDKLFDDKDFMETLYGSNEESQPKTLYKYDDVSQKLQNMHVLGDSSKSKTQKPNKTKMPALKKAPSLSTLFEPRNLDEDQSSSGIESDTNSSHESEHKANATILQKTMQHENFQIYLKILAKYEQEFQKIIQDYENEEIDNKILVATTSFDAILSYNEIIYYSGKIVESMMLENVHKNNRNLLENDPIEELEYCKKRIYDCRDALIKNERNENRVQHLQRSIDYMCSTQEIKNNNANTIKIKTKERDSISILDEEKKHELRNKIKTYALRASKIYMDYEELQPDDYCINNFFNNFCLFFSNFCRFCLIMKLYLSLTLKSNKVRNLVTEIKSIANIREDDTEFFYFGDDNQNYEMNDLEDGLHQRRRVSCMG